MNRALWALALTLLLTGCGLLRSTFVEPDVSIAALRLGQSDGLYQHLLIDLVITNPGRNALELAALHYRIRVEGRELVSGVSRKPLSVAPGGTVRYTVPAGFNLLSGIGLARDLLAKSDNSLRYELEATLEPDSPFWQPIQIRRADVIPLQPLPAASP